MTGHMFNGTDPRPLRLVVIGESIVSDWGNPAATSWRALLRALLAAGHDAVFLEQRKNDAVVALLRARGAEPMKAFGRRYPELLNRTYELPRGAERSVWFGREVSTADAAIILDDAPEEIFAEIAAYDTPRLVKVLVRTDPDRPGPVAEDRSDLVLGSEVTPAVEIVAGLPPGARTGVIVVAYEDQTRGDAVAKRLDAVEPELVTPGRLTKPWRYVPEVEVSDLYARAVVAVVVGGPDEPGLPVRLLLPLASGCPVIAVVGSNQIAIPGIEISTATVETVAATVAITLQVHPAAPAVSPVYDAAVIAGRFVERVRRIRAERMGAYSQR